MLRRFYAVGFGAKGFSREWGDGLTMEPVGT